MKTLIILHGWQSSKEKWQAVEQGIKEQGIKVILRDLPGFKKETELNRPWNLDDYVEWFKVFSEQGEVGSRGELAEPFFLLGHSFGGRIAIKFAAKYPEKVKGLILVSSAGIKRKNLHRLHRFNLCKFAQKFSFVPFYPFLRKIFYKYILRKTDYINAEKMPYLKETFKNIIQEDLFPYLSQIKTPTLIIWGEKDKITPLSDAYSMNKEIQNSKLEILKGVGHTPYLEKPEILAQKIKIFVG
jgi:pimeloyl-ACP methyl ester carboxylesterase